MCPHMHKVRMVRSCSRSTSCSPKWCSGSRSLNLIWISFWWQVLNMQLKYSQRIVPEHHVSSKYSSVLCKLVLKAFITVGTSWSISIVFCCNRMQELAKHKQKQGLGNRLMSPTKDTHLPRCWSECPTGFCPLRIWQCIPLRTGWMSNNGLVLNNCPRGIAIFLLSICLVVRKGQTMSTH